MSGIGIGIGMTFGGDAGTLTPQQIASLLTAPTAKTWLLGFGDSLLAGRVQYFAQTCAEVPLIGAQQLGSTIRYDQPGTQNVEICAPGSSMAAAVSPLLGGDVTWFPTGDHEVEFLGGLILAGSVNARISAHAMAAADFPLIWANLAGMPARVRTLAYRNAAAPTTEPGLLMVARSDADASYPPVAPNYGGAVHYNLTGIGYESMVAAIPDSFNWAGAATVNAEIVAVPEADTTNAEIVAYHHPWLEGDGPGVIFLEWAVGGTTGARYASDTLFPPRLFAPGGFFPTLCGDDEVVVYWALGINSPNEAVATQEQWIRSVIAKVRSGLPRAKFILTTSHFGNNSPSFDLNFLTATRNVAATTPNCLLLDTYLQWGNWRRGDAAGYYGDVVHLGAAGEAVKCAMIGDMLHDVASGIAARRIDFRLMTPGEGPETLPGGLVLASGVAANRTVQTSASTLVTNITQNRARIGRLAVDDPPALLLEPERTNLHTYPRTAPPAPPADPLILGGSGETGCAASGIVGPDGTGNATRYQVNSGGYSRFFYDPGAAAGPFVASQWERHTSATGANNITASATESEGESVTTTWTRIAVVSAGNPNLTHMAADGRDRSGNGGVTAGARDVLVDFCQIEDDAGYPTSPIPTANATRDVEGLSFVDALSTHLVGGRLMLALRLRPLAARASYKTTENHYFWYVDADNFCIFQPASGTVVIRVGGVNDGPAPTTIDWTADDVLDIYFECGNGAAATIVWRLNNGALTFWTGTQLTTLDDGTLHLLTDGTLTTGTYVESIDIGGRPRWTVAD